MPTEEERARLHWEQARQIALKRLAAARRLQAPMANLRALEAAWEPLKRLLGVAEPDEARDPLVGVQEVRELIVLQGPPGSQGITGPAGPEGPPGAALEFEQTAAATVWQVAHFLGYNPAVQVYDSLQNPTVGLVTYLDLNHLVITFSAAISGKAYLT